MTSPASTPPRGSRAERPRPTRTRMSCGRLAGRISVTTCEASALNSTPTSVGAATAQAPRRPSRPPAGAARVAPSRLGRDDLPHDDVVPPVVAEVVAVHHLRPLGPGHLGEGGGGLVLPFRPVVILVRRAELTAHR